jgi:hypothetical protein
VLLRVEPDVPFPFRLFGGQAAAKALQAVGEGFRVPFASKLVAHPL